MKKLLAALLTLTMLLSLIVVATITVSAAEGMWTTYGPASQYSEEFDGDPKSVPGYEYTEDGLHMIPADWTGTTPWGLIQTTEMVDLKNGVFMQVKVGDFSFEASDKWFNVNIWDSAMIEPPVEGFGEGVQTLIRPAKNNEGKANVSSVAWYTNNFTSVGTVNMVEDKNNKTAEGDIILDITVSWNGATYSVDINGSQAPAAVTEYMNKKWGGDESYAYIGICTQNNKTGGTIELTVSKFGTTAADATVPSGDDRREPTNYSSEKAPIADPNTVPANSPAVLMNASKADSHLKATPKPIVNTTLKKNDDNSLNITGNQGSADSGVWYVRNDVSYDIQDFPVGIILMRNFCTCGEDDGTCYALESVGVYMMTGESTAIGGNHVKELSMSEEAYAIGDDNYLYFYVDMMNDAAFEATGRINGACFDFSGIDYSTPGANSFDLMFMAWFRNVDEAQAYVENYLTGLGWSNGEETTEAPTDAPSDSETEAPAESSTEAPSETSAETPTESEGNDDSETGGKATESQSEEKNDNQTEGETEAPVTISGCGSSISLGAFVIVALAAAGICFTKKRR